MMRRPRFRLIILIVFVFFVFGCLLDSDEETYGVDGHVRDEGGQPVGGVLVRKTGSESGSTYTRSDGYYWLPLSRRSDAVALLAVKSGWAFCPGRIEIEDFSVWHHHRDFTGFYGAEIVIDGFVLDSGGNPVAGVKVVNQESGALNGLTSVTNYLGYYRFNTVIPGFSYRFVPQKPGCVFSPSEREYSLPARDYLRQDFVATCFETFDIQGHVRDCSGNPVAGVTLEFTPQDVTAVTDEGGSYAMGGLPASEAIEITPEKAGCDFSPASQTVYAAPDGVSGVDFSAHCGGTYSISGRLLLEGGGPLPWAKVRVVGGCGGQSQFTYTDDLGAYGFGGMHGGFDYVIKAEDIANAVQPESIVIERLDRDYVGRDFTVTSDLVEFRVTGYVRDREGIPLEGIEVDFSYLFPRFEDPDDMADPVPGQAHLPVITDVEGRFSIPVPRSWTVVFRVAGYSDCHTIPHARWCRGDQDHESQDFAIYCGSAAGISGYVRDIFGEPAPHVLVEISAEGLFPPPRCSTDSSGYYEFLSLPNDVELTVRPNSSYSIPYEGCIFCPPERVFSDVEEDYTDQDFTISCPSHLRAEPAPLCNIRPDPN